MMKRLTLMAAAVVLSVTVGCGSDKESDTTPTDAGLRIDPSPLALIAGAGVELKVFERLADGTERDVTTEAELSARDASVRLEETMAIGVSAGSTVVTATLGDLTTTTDATVSAEPILALELIADGSFEVGEKAQLRTVATTAGDVKHELVSGLSYTSSDPAVATVEPTGLVNILAGGPVTFTVKAGGVEATLSSTVTCDYPFYSANLQYKRVIPKLEWPAKRRDGTSFDFKMADLHCNAEWKDTKTLAIVLSAGWCTPCTLYAQRLEKEFEQLNALGMEIMIVEVQNKTLGELADLAFAWDHVDNITQTAPGIVVGDKDTRQVTAQGTQAAPGYLNDLPLLTAFPTALVVRTRDMMVIADSSRTSSHLPLAAIAKDPEADWANAGPKFTNECGTGDEEDSEPNDVFADAAPITVAGTYPGGICTDAADMYKVELTGNWTAEIAFEHDVGDLDLFVWDSGRDQPAQNDEGDIIGSATSNDVERLEYSGPAVIAIQGYQRASAPYTLTITER